MENFKIEDFIEKVYLDNTDQNYNLGDKSFETKDTVFIDSYNEIEGLDDNVRRTSSTDYALAMGAFQSQKYKTFTDKYSTALWLRSA